MNRPTRWLTIDPDRPDPDAIGQAAGVILAGDLAAFPTETVYGLGADATNPGAVARIYEAKGRPSTNPLIVHGGDVGDVRPAVSSWTPTAAKLARVFWPGPLTLVLARSGLIPDAVTAGRDTVGVRVPDSEVARALLARVGRPVAAPSANRSTGVSPTTAEHVRKDLDGRIELILDAGPTPLGIESTVLDLTQEPPRLLRPGAITAGQIGSVLGVEVPAAVSVAEGGAATMSPGQMEVHYAPRAHVQLIEPAMARHWPWSSLRVPYGLVVAGRHLPPDIGAPTSRIDWTEPVQAARELYSTLHRWDDEGLLFIFAVLPPNEDAWLAVRDRLWRASRRWAREGLGPQGA
jgi:L-threonylcarbamoyladenylate synthase